MYTYMRVGGVEREGKPEQNTRGENCKAGSQKVGKRSLRAYID